MQNYLRKAQKKIRLFVQLPLRQLFYLSSPPVFKAAAPDLEKDGKYALRLPDFVGIGAQKAGTSWWFSLMIKHPKIFLPDLVRDYVPADFFIKERHFLDKFYLYEFHEEAAAEYQKWFPCPEGKITGEWTPDYLAYSWAPKVLSTIMPDAKLLVMLRDPVDRMVSGLNHYSALRPVWGDRPRLRTADMIEQQMRGFYFNQLTHWLKHYPRESILILQYEKCKLDTQAELSRTFQFLNLSDHEVSQKSVIRKVNTQGTKIPFTLDSDLKEGLISQYEEDVMRLGQAFEEIDLSLWPNFRHLNSGLSA